MSVRAESVQEAEAEVPAPAAVRKPRALNSGSTIMPFAPASPADFAKVLAGAEELRGLGFHVADSTPLTPDGYFAGSATDRREELLGELERGVRLLPKALPDTQRVAEGADKGAGGRLRRAR